jgi:hypothetical protein
VSLILEALKKLEREKRSAEPGFLVLGPTSWAGGTRGTRGAMFALIAGLALLATALGILAWRNAGRGAAPASRVATTATPAAVPAEPPVVGPGAYVPPAQAIAPEPMPIATPLPAPTMAATAPAAAPADASGRTENAPQAVRVSEAAVQAVAEPPQPAPSAEPARFRLQAISVRDGKPVAVLNDRLVYEGESIDGVTVVRIGEAEVELEVDGRPLIISF